MRKFIDAVLGNQTSSAVRLNEGDEAGVIDDQVNDETRTDTEIENGKYGDALNEDGEDMGDTGLTGTIDAVTWAKLLPEVDNVGFFRTAVSKVKSGDIAMLNVQETRQLAKAFISILRDDAQTTVKLLSKLRNVQSDEAGNDAASTPDASPTLAPPASDGEDDQNGNQTSQGKQKGMA